MKEEAEDAEEAEEEMGAITGAPGGRWGVFDDGVGSGVDAIDLRQCWVELDGTALASFGQNRRPQISKPSSFFTFLLNRI